VRSTTQLRDEILAAARDEFARHGLAGSRIDRIAKTARASKERLYAHFHDKETLFWEVVTTDAQDYFAATGLVPHDVPAFVGDVFDLARGHPEHLRMITWARLEGLSLDQPVIDGLPEHALAAIEAAQATGHVDPSWVPIDLLILLFGIGLAWAQFPGPLDEDPGVVAAHRAAAVEAARRIVAPGYGPLR